MPAVAALPAQAADRATAEAIYAQYTADAAVPAGWTGSTDSCTVGEESAESLAATLRTVNGVRALMDLSPVTLDPDLNRQALAAALMMRANDRLSHFPSSEWRCYSEAGYSGASNSNLYLGRSGAAAIVGYMKDEDVYSLGHRRWISEPGQVTMGTGSTGTSNALWVLKWPLPSSTRATAWPPPGWIHGAWVPTRWSYTVRRPMCGCTVEDISVSVVRDGAPVAVGQVDLLGALYGTGTTVAWQMPPDALRLGGDAAFSIRIDGIRADGAPLPVEYAVNVIAPPNAPPPPDVVPEEDPYVDSRGGLGALRVARKGRQLTVRYTARQAGRLWVAMAAQRRGLSIPGARAARQVPIGAGVVRIRLRPAHVRSGTRLSISAGLVGVGGSLSRTLRVR